VSPTASPKQPMKVPEFLAWATEQLDSRYELVDGKVVAMAPERLRHALVKHAAARALEDAVRAAGLPCTVFPDGVTVIINENATREPDACIQCGMTADLDATTIEAPLVVVEVVSSSSERYDLGALLIEYFSVPSIRHYLVLLPLKSAVVHHRRGEDGTIITQIKHDGVIKLEPPGMTVAVGALLGPAFVGDVREADR
jgi:Uma2 family endonuclease